MMRLESIAGDLVAKLQVASSERQRAASLIACQLALQSAPIEAEIVSEALAQLKRDGVLTLQRIAELNDFAAMLDGKYLDLQDMAEESPMKNETLLLFGQARAVSALSFAGGKDAFAAAVEAIYEASMTVDDSRIICDVVLSAL